MLLASAQYGTTEGLLAAVLATAALLVGRVPEQGFDEDLYAFRPKPGGLLRGVATTEPLTAREQRIEAHEVYELRFGDTSYLFRVEFA